MAFTNTSHLSTAYLRKIIRFCAPSGVTDLNFRFTGTPSTGRGIYFWQRNLVVARLPVKVKFPQYFNSNPKGKGYLPVTLFDCDEIAVYIIAHELRHAWHKLHPKGYRIWGSRGQYSERDADAWAIQKVRAWRRSAPTEATLHQRHDAVVLLRRHGYSTRLMNAHFKKLGASKAEITGTVSQWLNSKSRVEMSELLDQLK